MPALIIFIDLLQRDRQMQKEARQMCKTCPTFVSSSKTYHSIRYMFMFIITVCLLLSSRELPCLSKSGTKGEKNVHIIENLLQFFIFDMRVH